MPTYYVLVLFCFQFSSLEGDEVGDRRTAAAAPDRGRPCSLCPVGGSQSAADENGGAFGCKFKRFVFFKTSKDRAIFEE